MFVSKLFDGLFRPKISENSAEFDELAFKLFSDIYIRKYADLLSSPIN